jgi:hypothetical protein
MEIKMTIIQINEPPRSPAFNHPIKNAKSQNNGWMWMGKDRLML